jgi:putative ABC transport system permease protein
LGVLTNEQVAKDTFHPLENAIASVDLVRALLWCIAAVIIGAVVYLSALERRRDFAVLKAVGATDRKLAGGLAVQAVLIAVVAVIIATGLQVLLRPAFPLRIRVPRADYWRVPLLAAVVGLLAAAAAMRSVVRTDPAVAFTGAGA